MAFLDDLKDKASDAAVVAGRAVSDVYEATRIKMAIAEKKGTVKAIFKEVGEMVYNSYKDGEIDKDEIEDKISEIDSIMEEIAALKDKQMKIKKLRSCAGCGSKIPEDCKFCPKCGKDLTETEESAEAEIVEPETETEETEE